MTQYIRHRPTLLLSPMSPLPVPFRCTLHTSLSFPLPFYCSRSSRPSVLPDIRLPISQHRCGNNPSQADTTVVLAPTCSSYFLACGCWLVAASQMSPHPRCRRTPDVAGPRCSPQPDSLRISVTYGCTLPGRQTPGIGSLQQCSGAESSGIFGANHVSVRPKRDRVDPSGR